MKINGICIAVVPEYLYGHNMKFELRVCYNLNCSPKREEVVQNSQIISEYIFERSDSESVLDQIIEYGIIKIKRELLAISKVEKIPDEDLPIYLGEFQGKAQEEFEERLKHRNA